MDSTLEDQLKTIQGWLKGPGGEAIWTVMTAFRGPDSPSERPDQDAETRERQYRLRRDRKRDTVEVIRGKALNGVSRGARVRTDTDTVVLPPQKEWDHFDRHVASAASVLGLKIQIRGTEPEPPRREGRPLVDMPVSVKKVGSGATKPAGPVQLVIDIAVAQMLYSMLDKYGLMLTNWPLSHKDWWKTNGCPKVTLLDLWQKHTIENYDTAKMAAKLINDGQGSLLLPIA